MKWKNENIAYLIALPAIILAFIFKLFPLAGAFKLPFLDYKTNSGIRGSNYIGLKNFSNLFSAYYFRRLVSNTFILKIGFVFVSGIIALILGIALSYIKERWLRDIFIIIFTIPFFVPIVVFSYIVLLVFKSHPRLFLSFKEVLLNPERFRLMYIILESLRTSGILSIIVFYFIKANRRKENTSKETAFKAIVLFLFIQLSSIMTVNFEMLNEFINPLVYNAAGTLDTFIFESGIISGDVNQAASIWFLRFIIQLPITIGVYYIIKSAYYEEFIERKELKYDVEPSDKIVFSVAEEGKVEYNESSRLWSVIICLIYASIFMIPIISIFSIDGGVDNYRLPNMDIFTSFIKYIFITSIATILNLVITVLLAYPLSTSHSKKKTIYEIFLLILLVAGQGGVHEYIYFEKLGLINTIYPYILNGFFSVMNIFVLGSIYMSQYKFSNFREYLYRIWKPAIALAGFQFIAMWNSYYPSQILYLNNPEIFSPVMIFKNIVMDMQTDFNASLLTLGFLVSLPSIVIGIAICLFADNRVFISRIRD